ncbi:MAG: CBU_0592 family membrane protein [Desulfovibrio sp.]|uniref:CBU_0592 family membrane protein n=1 Tax=Desulfovibrio sp. 7SRBS1 TaxID=3378064 RepID=UPI003B3C8762
MGTTLQNPAPSEQTKKRGTALLFEVVGWYGTAAIVLAYLFVSLGMLDSKGLPYQLLNLTGAFGIIAISFRKKAYQPAVLNVIWAVIALIAIGKVVL